MNKSGCVLISVGAVLLAHNFGFVSWDWFQQWWPALLILLGLWSIVSRRAGDRLPKTLTQQT